MTFDELKEKIAIIGTDVHASRRLRALSELFQLVSAKELVTTSDDKQKFTETQDQIMTTNYRDAIFDVLKKYPDVFPELPLENADSIFEEPLPKKEAMKEFKSIITNQFIKQISDTPFDSSHILDLKEKIELQLAKCRANISDLKNKIKENDNANTSSDEQNANLNARIASQKEKKTQLKNVLAEILLIEVNSAQIVEIKKQIKEDYLDQNTSNSSLKDKVRAAKNYLQAQHTLSLSIDAYNTLPDAAVVIPNTDPEKEAQTIVERGTDPITGYTHDVITGIQYLSEMTHASDNRLEVSEENRKPGLEFFGDTLTGGRMARTYRDYDLNGTAAVKSIALRDEHGTVTDHSTKNLNPEQKKTHAIEMAKLYARTYTGNGPIVIAGGNDPVLAKMIHATLIYILPKATIKNYVPSGEFSPGILETQKGAAEKLIGKQLLDAASADISSSFKLVSKPHELNKERMQELRNKGQVTDVKIGEQIERNTPSQ